MTIEMDIGQLRQLMFVYTHKIGFLLDIADNVESKMRKP